MSVPTNVPFKSMTTEALQVERVYWHGVEAKKWEAKATREMASRHIARISQELAHRDTTTHSAKEESDG